MSSKIKFTAGILMRARVRATLAFHCGEFQEFKGLLSSSFVATVPEGKAEALVAALKALED